MCNTAIMMSSIADVHMIGMIDAESLDAERVEPGAFASFFCWLLFFVELSAVQTVLSVDVWRVVKLNHWERRQFSCWKQIIGCRAT